MIINRSAPLPMCVSFIILLTLPGLSHAEEHPGSVNWQLGLVAMAMVMLVVVGAVWYMSDLQKRFYAGAMKTNKLDKFFSVPAGLPQGTIRSILAMMIVVISLFFITLQFFFDREKSVPEGLMTLLSAVVAFYFANRASAQGAEASVALQTKEMQQDLDTARKDKDESDTQKLISKLSKASQVLSAGTRFLPEKYREKYGDIINKVQTGLSTADTLINKKNASGAKDLMEQVFDDFAKNNPVVDAVKRAIPAFEQVLKGSVPALGLLITVATIGVKLGSARYEKWKRRVLFAPITIAQSPPQTFDGITAKILFSSKPLLAAAFQPELQQEDLLTLESAANDFIRIDKDGLWQKYGARFDSEAAFDQCVLQFRQMLMDRELKPYVDSIGVGPAESYQKLMTAIDTLHEDEAAKASLDEFMLIVEGLMREGQPVLQIMEKVQQEMESHAN